MARPFTVRVRTEAGVGVLELHGQIDGSAGADLQRAYAEVAPSSPHGVILDFADVDYINSAGIAHIVGVLASARADHRPVCAAALSDHYREIFAITRLSDYIDLYADLPSAISRTTTTA